jgi:hypothetical protein
VNPTITNTGFSLTTNPTITNTSFSISGTSATADYTQDTTYKAIERLKNQLTALNTKITNLQTAIVGAIDSTNYTTAVVKSFTMTLPTATLSYATQNCITTTTVSGQNAMSFTLGAGTWRLIAFKIYNQTSGSTFVSGGMQALFINGTYPNYADAGAFNPTTGNLNRNIVGVIFGKTATVVGGNWSGNNQILDFFQGTTTATAQQTQNLLVFPSITTGTTTFYMVLMAAGTITRGASEVLTIDATFQRIN